jgi:hypothetical protein
MCVAGGIEAFASLAVRWVGGEVGQDGKGNRSGVLEDDLRGIGDTARSACPPPPDWAPWFESAVGADVGMAPHYRGGREWREPACPPPPGRAR